MPHNSILVTGGAGYIGSHTIRALVNHAVAPENIIVVDDLSTGFKQNVIHGVRIYKYDIADQDNLSNIIDTHRIDTVLHFAAKLIVEESVRDPAAYYANNTAKTQRLIDTARENNIEHFIFSSTAATYGDAGDQPVNETDATMPTNPYGRSKLASEWYLQDINHAAKLRGQHQMNYAILRYFNVAGAHYNGDLGQRSRNATHLIKMCCKAAKGEIEQLTIYGNDYPTSDGSCVRDYIHVDDLANAHISALHGLKNGAPSGIYNVGYGSGYSVREVIDTFKRVNSVEFKVVEGARREGDAISVIANAEKIRSVLGWVPEHADLSKICHSAWTWEQTLK